MLSDEIITHLFFHKREITLFRLPERIPLLIESVHSTEDELVTAYRAIFTSNSLEIEEITHQSDQLKLKRKSIQ